MPANRFAQLVNFTVMSTLKILTYPFYRFDRKIIGEKGEEELNNVKLIVLLNHTSLYETLFIRLAPYSFLWRIARYLLVPVADITTKRPIVGRFFGALVPGIVPISRKRDDSWATFLNKVDQQAIVAILPEGRMRRHDGRDKFGKPMSVRSGIADIIEKVECGNILFVYSGGLHHIQIPGQTLPKLFKTVKVNLEMVDAKAYKIDLFHEDEKRRKRAYVKDIQQRLERNTPFCRQQPYNQN